MAPTASLPVLAMAVLILLPNIMRLCDAERTPEGDEDLFIKGNYYTMHIEETHVTLKIRLDGSIAWDHGTPTLYSLFHEKILHERDSGERMYTLEAIASRHWICMTGKGKLYTRRQPPFYQFEKSGTAESIDEWGKIRHPRKKGEGGPRRRRRPPSDCLFKTYEFSTSYESYERAVGIYSYAHSNHTHGRFLSISPFGGARTYRKAFRNIAQFSPVKITQVPIRYLKEMVRWTSFGKEPEYNEGVRQCILQLLSCPKHRMKVKRGRWAQMKQHHFFRIIERCKRRMTVGGDSAPTPPRCAAHGGGKGNWGGTPVN